MLMLDGTWSQCRVRVNPFGPPQSLTISGLGDELGAGTSGSPIADYLPPISEASGRGGRAIGLISTTTTVDGISAAEHHGQPLLATTMPSRLLVPRRTLTGGGS